MPGIYDYQTDQVKQRQQQNNVQNNEAMNRRMASMGGGPSGAAEKLQLQSQNQNQQNAENDIAGINANQGQEEMGYQRKNSFNDANQKFEGNQADLGRQLSERQQNNQINFGREGLAAQATQNNVNNVYRNKQQDLESKWHDQQMAFDQSQADQDNNFFSAKNLGGIARGGIGAAIGGLFSDKDLKKDIAPADKYIGDFLEEVKPSQYEYKDPKNGVGKQYGVMAQDLEKHPVGASLVISTPEGKKVDMAKGGAVILAAQSSLHRRLKQLESEDS